MQCTIGALASVLRNPVALALSLATAAAAPALMAGQAANAGQPQVAFVQVESKEKRLQYLATAQIWADPGELTPDALLAGPPLEDGSGLEAALDGRPFPCTFAKPGKTMGGNTTKFLLYHGHGQHDPGEVQRRVEERQPRSVCGGRGVTPAVGAGVQV